MGSPDAGKRPGKGAPKIPDEGNPAEDTSPLGHRRVNDRLRALAQAAASGVLDGGLSGSECMGVVELVESLRLDLKAERLASRWGLAA